MHRVLPQVPAAHCTLSTTRSEPSLHDRSDLHERLLLFLATQLTARGVDVAAPALADVRVNTLLAQDRLEGHDVVAPGPCEWKSGNFVIANEVHVGAQRPG